MLTSRLHLRADRLAMTLLALAAFGLAAHPAQAQNNPLITLDELGSGSIIFPGAASTPLPGTLAPDPGPGGLAAALTYNLLGPPSLVAGDVFIFDGATISDVIRFNPAGTGSAGYPASAVFYSTAGSGTLADTGFPTAFYGVAATAPEIGGIANYTPTANQPGFVAGFNVSYKLISDAPVPEASTTVSFGLLLALGMGGVVVAGRRKKKTSASL
jgi:hypothetical protein